MSQEKTCPNLVPRGPKEGEESFFPYGKEQHPWPYTWGLRVHFSIETQSGATQCGKWENIYIPRGLENYES